MRPNCRSRGVAIAEAMVSGLAPGIAAPTEMVGKSTWGSGETGRNRNAATPESATAMVSRVVATGLWMKGLEMFMAREAARYLLTSRISRKSQTTNGRPQKTVVCTTTSADTQAVVDAELGEQDS